MILVSLNDIESFMPTKKMHLQSGGAHEENHEKSSSSRACFVYEYHAVAFVVYTDLDTLHSHFNCGFILFSFSFIVDALHHTHRF